MPTLSDVEREVKARLAAVANNPAGRYQMRQIWYARYGYPEIANHAEGFGNSELAFMRWEVKRGVLDALTAGGSAWWRALNDTLLYESELASALIAAGIADQAPSHACRQWVAYLDGPSSDSWYRAHNSSIIAGYVAATNLADEEIQPERTFMNQVLYRLMFAQAMVMGKAFGDLGEIAADPRLFAVEVIVNIPALYPINYPLNETDIKNVNHVGKGFEADLGRLLDLGLILPHLTKLYNWAASINETPELIQLQRGGRPIYPNQTLAAPLPALPAGQKRKIAILGSGMSAMTAAFELTRDPNWSQSLDVTIYTLGWRCGGKTATGRGPNKRIEEHGIHILQGWYDNTFRLLDEIFAEREAKGLDPQSPFQNWQAAFTPNNTTLITEFRDGGWNNWTLVLPTMTDTTPGQGPPLSTWQIIKKVIAIILEMLLGSPYDPETGKLARWILSWFYPPDAKALGADPSHQPVFADVVNDETLPTRLLEKAKSLVEQADLPTAPPNGNPHPNRTLVEFLGGALDWFRNQTDSPTARLRTLWYAVELAWVNLKGILVDVWNPFTGKMNWSRVDKYDYRAWIRSHGASENCAQSSIVKFLYTGTFSNLADGQLQGGSLAAGTALQFLVRSAGYKGSFVYQFDYGTGDTMVAPFYQVLAARGVKFEFFRQVKQLHWSAGTIDNVTIGEQVTLKDGLTSYSPLETVGNVKAWPAEPLYDQLDPDEARELRAKRIDLEDPWADWVNPKTRVLTKGVDYDEIILGIPIAALKDCCSDIIAHDPAWQAMVNNVRTTATMSTQLWVKPNLVELGFVLKTWGLPETGGLPNAVTYANPMYSWLDQSLVLHTEQWPADNAPQTIAYFTGSMDDPPVIPPYSDHRFIPMQLENLKGVFSQWMWDNMGFFWPGGTRPAAPNGFDNALLVYADEPVVPNATPQQKWASQYFRANLFPWARYTNSVPGSAVFRLKADASGYDNLWLCGDWIDFGVNVGYIEGAIVSGMQAAGALGLRLGVDTKAPMVDPDTE